MDGGSMPEDDVARTDAARLRLVTAALRLVCASVAFGVLSGAVSVTTGLREHSLGVFAVGLGVLADVTGSAVLIWRFAPSAASRFSQAWRNAVRPEPSRSAWPPSASR
jgi:hypothetical protein